MDDAQNKAHSEHLQHQQEHFQWRQEHMQALAILKRAEAALFVHEARILAHDAEIARHEEAIAHGDTHVATPAEGEHAAFRTTHAAGSEHHAELIKAIRALEPYVSSEPS
jgi:hypothetical protein